MVGFADKDYVCVFGYDPGTRDDIPTLVIGKRSNGVVMIVAEYVGDEAVQEYKKIKEMRMITNGKAKKEIY